MGFTRCSSGRVVGHDLGAQEGVGLDGPSVSEGVVGQGWEEREYSVEGHWEEKHIDIDGEGMGGFL